jgi:hypothetical protein
MHSAFPHTPLKFEKYNEWKIPLLKLVRNFPFLDSYALSRADGHSRIEGKPLQGMEEALLERRGMGQSKMWATFRM